MNGKRTLLAATIVLLALLLGSFAASSAIPSTIQSFGKPSASDKVSQTAVTTDIVNGTVNGTDITWEYGNRTFTDSGNFTVFEQGRIHEKLRETRIVEKEIPLIVPGSFNVEKIFYEVEFTNSTANETHTLYLSQTQLYNAIVFLSFSRSWTSFTNITEYGVSEAIVVTTDEEFLGFFPVNVSFLEWFDNSTNMTLTLIYAPRVVVASVQKIIETLLMNQTVVTEFFADYYMKYSFKYNIEASEWYVEVRDDNRLFFHLSAPRSLTLNYTEIQAAFLNYWYYSLYNVSLNFLNGTAVPEEMYPFSLSPSFFQANGTIFELNVNFANLTAISTATTVLQAFHARISETVNNTSVNASALVAWAVQSAPRLAAYEDGNLDGQLNLQFSPEDGLDVTDGDSVPYVGITEAYKGNVISIHHVNHTRDSRFITRIGLMVVNETEDNVQEVGTRWRFHSFNVGGDFGDPNMVTYFNEPVKDGDMVIFNFGVEYQDFPVTWVNTLNGSQTVVPMDIGYDFEYTINTTAGKADLSPTITYGAITDPKLKAAMNGLGLATLYVSDFLTAFAFQAKRVEQAEENVTSSRAALFKTVRFSGPESEFSTIDATGPKATYNVSGQTYGANISVLNLVKVSASVVAANVTVFESETGDAMSSSYLQQTEVAGIHVGYRKDLILVSYPVWNGDEIVHDPTFSAVYVPPPPSQGEEPEPTTTTEPTGGNETVPPPTTTTPSEDTRELPQPTQPVPGFTAFSVILLVGSLAALSIINRRRRRGT